MRYSIAHTDSYYQIAYTPSYYQVASTSGKLLQDHDDTFILDHDGLGITIGDY